MWLWDSRVSTAERVGLGSSPRCSASPVSIREKEREVGTPSASSMAVASTSRTPPFSVSRPSPSRDQGVRPEPLVPRSSSRPVAGLAQLGEEEAAAVAEVGVVNAELVAVIAHGQRLGLVARQRLEAGEVGQPFGRRSGSSRPTLGRRALVAEAQDRLRESRAGATGSANSGPRAGSAGRAGRRRDGHRRPVGPARRGAPQARFRFCRPARHVTARAMRRPLTLDFLKTESARGAGAGRRRGAGRPGPGQFAAGRRRYFAFMDRPIPVQPRRFRPDPSLAGLGQGRPDGRSSSWSSAWRSSSRSCAASFPAPAAWRCRSWPRLGGMVVPALIYLAVNAGAGGTPRRLARRHGHGHRLRPGGADRRRPPPARLAAPVPADPGHRRRSRRGGPDRHCLFARHPLVGA